MIAHASGHEAAAQNLVARLQDVIIDPLLVLFVAVALLVFLWGGFQYVTGASADEAREEGRRHMIWGIVGLLIMLSAYAIISIAAGTFGVPIPG